MEIDAYGIYKKLSNHDLQQRYLQARQFMMNNHIEQAKQIISQAIDYARMQLLHSDLNVLNIIQREINFYLNTRTSQSNSETHLINLTDNYQRSIQIWDEGHNQLPQSIFLLQTDCCHSQMPISFVGRKHLSNLYIENKIPELHCSQIRSTMLFGIFHHSHSSQSNVKIYYYPLQQNEKQFLFDQIQQQNDKLNTEIIYPFCLLHPLTHEELHSEPDGWLLTEEMVDELNQGETHLRDYSVKMILENKLQICNERSVIYDPACSTGQFLFTLKCSFPWIHTIGQDLSRSMIEYVQNHNHADEAIHLDAEFWPMNKDQVDMIFIRFLNSEVVTTTKASVLFNKILDRIKRNGQVVVLVHTPVLLSSSDFLSIQKSLVVEQCIGITNDSQHGIALFQYYILKQSL